MQLGDTIITSTGEEYRIIELPNSAGYLWVQRSAFYKMQMASGKELIHQSEIDGVGLKHIKQQF